MGKIKSSREIAMERTARILAEKAGDLSGLDRRQYIKAAELLARAYLGGGREIDQVAEAVSRYPHEVKQETAKALLKTACQAINLENCPRVQALVEHFLSGDAGPKLASNLGDLCSRYRESLQQNREHLSRDAARAGLAQLKQAGISGSAIGGVNLERSAWWKQAAANTARVLEDELEQLKNELLSALEQ